VAISALTGAGFAALLTKIDEALPLDTLSDCTFRIPAGDGGPIHTLHEHARVISTCYADEMCVIRAETPESIRRRLAKYLVA
jgi:50S ribosomal subunit-associated GTPase HflX